MVPGEGIWRARKRASRAYLGLETILESGDRDVRWSEVGVSGRDTRAGEENQGNLEREGSDKGGPAG